MRGYSHALTGAAAWGGLTTGSVLGVGLLAPHPARDMAGMVLVAGFALLPDSDHHSGSIARSVPSIGPVTSPTRVVCRAVSRVSGGHRHGTHSLAGIAVFTGLAWLASLVTFPAGDGPSLHLGSGLLAGLGIAFAVKAMRWSRTIGTQVSGGGAGAALARVVLRSWAGPWLLAGLGAGVPTHLGYEWPLIVPMVALGCLVHVLGDMLTVGGVPWLWPLHPAPPRRIRALVAPVWYRNGYFALAVLGRTTSTRETGFAVLAALYVGWAYLHALASLGGHALP